LRRYMSGRRARLWRGLCLAATLTFAVHPGVASAAAEASYPVKSITMIVPFAAGGPTDVVARIVADSMSVTLGQPIIIENVVGSGGTTAVIRAKRSPPDGYTVVMGHMGTHGAAVALNPHLAYDPMRDFEPIGLVTNMPVLILARKRLDANTLVEFIELMRSRGESLNMAHAGVGSVSYATCLLLNSIVGTRPRMTAFQGTAPAMTALVEGRVDYMCDQAASVVPQIAAGTVKAYAVGTASRNLVFPDVPTSIEAGAAAFQASAWNALFVPKGTPKPVIASLNSALGKALDDDTVRSQLLRLGSEIPAPPERTPQSLAELVKSEIAKWTAAIRPANSEN
jgi:tripartite-type tricarboxylate transporter receptor subunit TctC